MGDVILCVCTGVSSFIMITILLDFMNKRYARMYKRNYVYTGVEFFIVIGITIVTLKRNIFWNLLVWMLVAAFNAYFFFYEDLNKPVKRILECEELLFACIVCGQFGADIIRYLLCMLQIELQEKSLRNCVELLFSKVVIIFVYRILISRFVKMINEKEYLEYDVRLLENQAEIQRKYYMQQEKKYNRTVRVLHDVNKHIKVIEQLYRNGMIGGATEYAKQIKHMLEPLLPVKYTGNPILDILLTDKAVIIKEKKIEFEIKVNNVNLNFIDSVDVTVIFGNLLDNSIEACESMDVGKKIFIDIHSYYEMVTIRIENTCTSVKWKNGLPVSQKGKDRGIGLSNVMRCIEKYDGNMKLNSKDGKFTVDIILNS